MTMSSRVNDNQIGALGRALRDFRSMVHDQLVAHQGRHCRQFAPSLIGPVGRGRLDDGSAQIRPKKHLRRRASDILAKVHDLDAGQGS